ncbi:MAG: hypothetical protein ACI93R_001272 [Flavobacteriales bacterium]|jgi:hypothetical protein
MKYTLILLILSSSLSHACIVGPRDVADGSEKGFFVETEQSKFCDNCINLIAEAPLVYEGSPYSHVLLSVYLTRLVTLSGGHFIAQSNPVGCARVICDLLSAD